MAEQYAIIKTGGKQYPGRFHLNYLDNTFCNLHNDLRFKFNLRCCNGQEEKTKN